MKTPRTGSTRDVAPGQCKNPSGDEGIANRMSTCCPMSPASKRSKSDVAPRMCPHGSCGEVPTPLRWTTRGINSRRRASCRMSSVSGSRSSTPMASDHRSLTGVSTSRSPSTEPRRSAIRTVGSLRRRGSFDPVVDSCSRTLHRSCSCATRVTRRALQPTPRSTVTTSGRAKFVWRESDGSISDIDFHIGHGDMVRLLRRCGFEIEDLIELQAPAEADEEWPHIPLAWARRWPSAEIWRACKAH